MDDQKPRVKICCISSREEAQTAVRYGASAIGLVSDMPSGPGVISEDIIAEIAAFCSRRNSDVSSYQRAGSGGRCSQQKKTRATTIQLVDSFPVPGILCSGRHCQASKLFRSST